MPKPVSRAVVKPAVVPLNLRPKHYDAFVGVDPGWGGGMCTLLGDTVFVAPMPATYLEIKRLIDGIPPNSAIVIERVHSMPKQGVASTFKFGLNYGALLLALADRFHEDIPPQAWQKALNIPPKKKDEKKTKFKERLRAKSQQFFPDLAVWNDTLKYQRAVCDAMLIATFCRRKFEGTLGVNL